MKIFASYQIPLRVSVKEGEEPSQDGGGSISGHGYFDLPEFTEEALTGLEKYLTKAVTEQLKSRHMEPAGPPVFSSIAKLDESAEPARIIS